MMYRPGRALGRGVRGAARLAVRMMYRPGRGPMAGRPAVPAFTVSFDGGRLAAAPGQTVAAVLWAAGVRSWRTTSSAGTPRGLFCGIGACFDCLVTIDGEPNRRACLVPARLGMVVTTQRGVGR